MHPQWKISGRFVNLLLACLLIWLGMDYFLRSSSHPHAAPLARTRLEEESFSQGMESYKSALGNYPTGESSDILRALTGDNSQNRIFLSYHRSLEHPNEMVDAWGTPYAIRFLASNAFTISSAGKNKIFGDKDDIVFSSISNKVANP